MQLGKLFRSGSTLAALAAFLMLLVACGAPVASLTSSNVGDGDAAWPSQQTGARPFDMVQVVGTGKATGTPDIADLQMEVRVTAATVASARTTAAATMVAVMASLTANNIAAHDMATRNFRVHPEYDYSGPSRTLTGYTVGNALNVTVRDIDGVGSVIDAAIAAGGNHVVFNSLSFSFSNTAALERQARAAAVADMADKAEQLSEFSGRELGDLKVVSEGGLGMVEPLFDEVASFGAQAARSDTPILPGEDEVTVSVLGIYELLPPADGTQ